MKLLANSTEKNLETDRSVTQKADLAYYQAVEPASRGAAAVEDPVCLYLEVSNECNLACKTCPITYAKVEEPAVLSLEQVKRLVSQFSTVKRVVLHGVGEPLLNRELPTIISWLKEKEIYVLFNSNGTLINRRWREALIDSGLDEIRLSLDAANPETLAHVRGKQLFHVLIRNIKGLMALKLERESLTPLVSLWLTGLRETLNELPDFMRLPSSLGIARVYLQRLVYWEGEHNDQMARPEQSLFNSLREEEEEIIRSGEELARKIGGSFEASGATSPAASLVSENEEQLWWACMRPWTLMYISARGVSFPAWFAPCSTKKLSS